MKKLIALILCLMLVAMAPIACADATLPSVTDGSDAVLGDTAPVTQPLTSYSGMYTIDLPLDYLPINENTLADILSVITVETLTEAGMDETSAQAMVNTIAAVDYENTDFAFTSDLAGNINGIVTPGIGMTIEILTENADALGATLTAQYAQFGVAESDCESIGMVTTNENPTQWYAFYVNFMGQTMHQYITCTEAGDQITLTFTGIPEADELMILNSFAFVAAE